MIKKFKKFIESYEITSSDDIDVRLSKEKLIELNNDIKEYKSKKSQVDSIFKSNIDIDKQIDRLLGQSKNTFLVDYIHISKLKNKIENNINKNAEDKIKLDDFKNEMSVATDQSVKNAVNLKIVDINKRIAQRIKDINTLKSDISKSEKEHIDRMRKMESDIKSNINKISISGK